MIKSIIRISALTLLMASSSALAQHAGHGAAPKGATAPTWTTFPMVLSAGGYSRSDAKYQAYNMHAMQAESYASFYGHNTKDLETATRPLTVDDNGGLTMEAGDQGGYYLVRVMGHGPNGEEATATTQKYFSNPGPAPRDLLNSARSGFEITPTILPREHSHYRENETWSFNVRMDGKPVEGLPVILETSNGSKFEYMTKADGTVDVTFPQDFKDIPKTQWRHGRPPRSKFVIAVRDGALLATYNDSYELDAYGDKDLLAGIGFAVLGMALAVPVVRRRKKTNGETSS
ncbi:MAG: hypothetical protein OQK24_02960 [Magnetovibrio sp.]|nr:hypothetical protein [Magnetovibrio sp.]